MSGLGLVILQQPGQFLDQNPLNPLNPVNIFVFDGTITKPIWPMSSINFYKMNLLSMSHSPQVNFVDYRNLMPCHFAGVPKCFGLVRIFCDRPKIYLHIEAVTNILCQTKIWFAFSNIGFCAGTKVFEEELKFNSIFGLAQNICTGTKHFGTCKRTRH